MYYLSCEKQTNGLFGTWQPRLLAFDTTRRYMYYTAHGTRMEGALWKGKMKVTKINQMTKEQDVPIDHPRALEKDYYVLEILGEHRPLASGEIPPPEPLLCPSTGTTTLPDRFSLSNEAFIRDRFFLGELYDSLRDQFDMLREQQGIKPEEANNEENKKKILTITSPRRPGKVTHVRWYVRPLTEYDFRRFWYVVHMVLGYDKLNSRPYRGLPPYDPRNGIFFGQIPMYVWHTFKSLNKTVFYAFMRGSLTGRKEGSRELNVTLRGAFLCITYDSVLVMQDTGHIPTWVRLLDVREFHYNTTSNTPYFCFVSDSGAPDIIFIPQPPLFSGIKPSFYDPQLSVLRVRNIIHEICFASLTVRRVITIRETAQPSVRAFVEFYERGGRQMQFDMPPAYASQRVTVLPHEQLASVWVEAERIYDEQDHDVANQSAIPIYANNNNEVINMSRDQLQVLARRLYRERRHSNSVTGVSYDEVRRNLRTAAAPPPPRPPPTTGVSVPSGVGHSSSEDASNRPLPESVRSREESTSFNNNGSFLFNVSFAGSNMGDNTSFANSGGYQVPGTRYLTEEDLPGSQRERIPTFLVDQHERIESAAQSPATHPQYHDDELLSGQPQDTPLLARGSEVTTPVAMTVETLVNDSFANVNYSPEQYFAQSSTHRTSETEGSNSGLNVRPTSLQKRPTAIPLRPSSLTSRPAYKDAAAGVSLPSVGFTASANARPVSGANTSTTDVET